VRDPEVTAQGQERAEVDLSHGRRTPVERPALDRVAQIQQP